MDVGALSHSYGLLKTRKIIRILERVCGARMHANYFRPGGVNWIYQ
jgi:NADH-quinone oxidoreductase subunit D